MSILAQATDLRAVVGATVADLRRSAETGRDDRLWPADPRLDVTNPLSLAYGACGPILLLHEAGRHGLTGGGVPDELVDWVLARRPSSAAYPAGLYVGLAGIAYTLLAVGRTGEAEAIMAGVAEHPTAFTDPGVLFGSAGWGLAALHFAARTGSDRWLGLAVRAGEHLLDTAERPGGQVRWRCADGVLHYGFGLGSAGIALFLAHLHAATGRDDFRAAAAAGLDHDLAKRFESTSGWLWGRYEGDTLVRPYWMEGSSGIGAVALRTAALLGEDRGEVTARIAHDAHCTISLNPNQFQGMAGIGELMIDMYRATGTAAYRADATQLADTMQLFAVRDDEGGIRWPSRTLDGTVTDYATGAAGIGLFLLRLLRPGPRLLLDLDLDPGD